MNKQNAVIARNYATQKLANNIIDQTNELRDDAIDDANDAYSYSVRDDTAFQNNYDGNNPNLNNQLVKLNNSSTYAYITNGGVAREIKGGIKSTWDDAETPYDKFRSVPYSNCHSSTTSLREYNSIDEIKVNSDYANIYQGNPIDKHNLTACGAEGKIVYINKFMDFVPIKVGGDEKFYVGDGQKFVFLDEWYSTDWETVLPWAATLATQSGYKSMKLIIGLMQDGRHHGVTCYASDVDLPTDIGGIKGGDTAGIDFDSEDTDYNFWNEYLTSNPGNKVSANSGNCPGDTTTFYAATSGTLTNPFLKTGKNISNTDEKQHARSITNGPMGNGLTDFAGRIDDAASVIWPQEVIDVNASEVINEIPIVENDTNDNKLQSRQKYRVHFRWTEKTTTGKGLSKKTTTKHPIRSTGALDTPCSEYDYYTQPYKVTCDIMSNYPGGPPKSNLQKCNAVYIIWPNNIKNSNVYVGNVGYVTPDAKMRHIIADLLHYDDTHDNLISYSDKRVCRHSKQYLSNTDQILKKARMSLEEARNKCANNPKCAGFTHYSEGNRVTFFKKTWVHCGEKLNTLNCMLPLTEDTYLKCTTVWKPLILKIKNRNDKFLRSDNTYNMTRGQDNRGKVQETFTGSATAVVGSDDDSQEQPDIKPNFYYANQANYKPDVRNITGGCPEDITEGYYGQLWYGYRNNDYKQVKSQAYICRKIETDTIASYKHYMNNTLPKVNRYIKNALLPALSTISSTTNNIMNASTQKGPAKKGKFKQYSIEGLTSKEKKYGDRIVSALSKSIPHTITYNGNDYVIRDKNQLNAYGVIQAQLEQGLITQADANIQMDVLFTNPAHKGAMMKSHRRPEHTTSSDDTVAETEVEAETGTNADASNRHHNRRHQQHHQQQSSSGRPLEYPAEPTRSKDVIKTINTIAENPQGFNQQMKTMVNDFISMGDVMNIQRLGVMNDDSYALAMKYGYGYGGWIILSLLVMTFIVLIAFNALPMLTNKTVLMPSAIVLGIICTYLFVTHYNLLPLIYSFMNYFIYYQ